MPLWAVCCRPWDCAGASAHLEKTGFRVESVSNFALRPFSRAATKHRKRNEKQHRKQPQKARKSARTNNHNKPSKMIIFGAKIDPRGEPKWPPGGLWARGRPQVAARPLRSRPWTARGSWSRLGALLGRSWGRLGVPGRPRWIDGRPFWVVFLEVCPGRLKNQRCLMFFLHFVEPLFDAFLDRLLSSLGLRRRGRAP